MALIRKAVVKDGKVVNVIEVDPERTPPEYERMPNCPKEVGVGWTWDGSSFTPKAQKPIEPGAVNAERDRRVVAGTDIDVTGYGTIPLQGREQDKTSLLALAQAAQLRISAGDTTTLTDFRDRDNQLHQMTPPQILELWQKGMAWVETVFKASWVLKDNPPIPQDYEQGEHWP